MSLIVLRDEGVIDARGIIIDVGGNQKTKFAWGLREFSNN